MTQKRVLLIVGGGIAAYKAPQLVRDLTARGFGVRVILTKAGAEFVTPLTLASLSGDQVYQDLFDLTAEAKMGHIELSRAADLVLVAPATADLIAKLAHGHANDLASTALLATDKPVMLAPSMNVRMWEHPAVVRNIAQLQGDGVAILGPDVGPMACGEFGPGRMMEPERIAQAVDDALQASAISPALQGRHVIVTAGPTREALDPIRYLTNRSSGKQGYAIAAALAQAGARVTLVSGPTALPCPQGVTRVDVESARDMLAACDAALPADVFIGVAAVADWRPEQCGQDKLKLKGQAGPPTLTLVENPDILAHIGNSGDKRPDLVIGFAAETQNLEAYAHDKRLKKGCDWIVANDVSGDVMDGDHNAALLLTAKGTQTWPRTTKTALAAALAREIAGFFAV
jgi:phosphopantothenoylcysteine decarboxylase/phosphopantothenate--cysteine ligase